jgi:prophage tail gpP-like protein
MEPEKLTLRVNGVEYGGWTSVRVNCDIDRVATSFSLGLSERWPDPRAAETGGLSIISRGISIGDACEIAIGGTLVCTGYVDRVEKSYSAQAHQVSVSGRSKTADLIDSAVPHDQQIRGKKLEDIARQLCAPHGIEVAVEGDTGPPLEEFHAKIGESVHGELERLCALRALLVSDGPGGGLILTRSGAGGGRTALRLGRSPILSGSAQWDGGDRFGTTIVRGQQPLGGAGLRDGPAVALGEGLATDPEVRGNRVRILSARGRVTVEELRRQAEQDVRARKGAANSLSYSLAGWRHPGGGLWWKGLTVWVEDDLLGVAGEYRIRSVNLALSDQGTTTDLTLAPPQAYPESGDPAPDSALSVIEEATP